MKGKSRQSEIFSHFASILPVKNVSKSIVFYQDKLGIELTFSWNNPVDYAVVKRGGVGIQLATESLFGAV